MTNNAGLLRRTVGHDIDSNIEVEAIVASEIEGFNDIPADLGYFGSRTSRM